MIDIKTVLYNLRAGFSCIEHKFCEHFCAQYANK